MYTVASGATLGGSGLNNASVNVSGDMAPGNSAGTFTVGGNYTQLANAALEIEIGGTGSGQFDVLNATESAALAGDLNVTLVEDFTPAWGDSFMIFSTGSLSGTFDTLPAECPHSRAASFGKFVITPRMFC
jgi:hypothetical protein